MDSSFVFFLIPVVGVAILAFFIIGFSNDAKHGGRGKGLFSAFTHSVSTLSLALVVGSTIVLVSLGLRATVLPRADAVYRTLPELYLQDASQSCEDGCSFSASEQRQVRAWLGQYAVWQGDAGTGRYRDELASALAFFLVGLPLFLVFFRMLQREARRGAAIAGMRNFYFYGIAVVGIIMTVLGAALLLNVGLRVAVGADEAPANVRLVEPVPPQPSGSVERVIACADACGFTAEEVAQARAWLVDAEESAGSGQSDRQRTLASSVPLFLVGLPLFLYHFVTIRRELHSAETASGPPAATV